MNRRRAIEKTPERTPIEIHIASLVNKPNPIRIYTDVNAKVKRRGYDYFEIVFPSGFSRGTCCCSQLSCWTRTADHSLKSAQGDLFHSIPAFKGLKPRVPYEI